MKLNATTARWIGLRAERRGRSTRLLKREGFWRENHGRANNRNACDYIMPCGPRTLKDFANLFARLAALDFRGIAFQWVDLQWKHNAGITDRQWQERIQIG